MGDRWRERGLDIMMAGKLEIDTEDELFRVSYTGELGYNVTGLVCTST